MRFWQRVYSSRELFRAHLHWQLLFFPRLLAQSTKPSYLGSYLQTVSSNLRKEYVYLPIELST